MAWIDDFLQHPSHAVLVTGSSAEASTEALNASQRILEGHEEYLRLIRPDTKGTISIEQIRTLITFFQLKVPGKAAIRRAAVIEQAEAMTREAQNALLKLLEEPPADSVLLLTSNQPQQLLSTIRSRVQTVHLATAQVAPDNEAVQLVKQVLRGTMFDRLVLIDGPLKSKEVAATFVATLAQVAAASLEATAHKGSPTARWQQILQAAHTAEDAFAHNANTKLVLTELMLAL